MSISHSYSFKRFNPVSATITVVGTSTDSATGTTLAFTRVLPLPVDTAGNVPTGPALTAYVETFLDGLLGADLARKASLAPHGGLVANSADLYALTTDVEDGELQGIQVNLIADQDFRNSFTGDTTRSILTVVALDENDFGLDNGNVDNATVTNIISSGFPDVAGPVTLTMLYDNIPQQYIDAYGNAIFGSHQTDSGYPAFKGQYYYVEHAPLKMYNQVTAVFQYA